MSKLIIFDFDGTLADSMWAWDELGAVTLCGHGIEIPQDYGAVIRTMSVPHFSEYLSKAYPQLPPPKTILAGWHKKMEYNYEHEIKLKKGAVEYLEYLKQKEYILHLASATHFSLIEKALSRFGIDKYFDYVITEDSVGVSKRDPKIYRLCAEKAGEIPGNIWLFEDAVHAVKTAKGFGMNVCAVKDKSMEAFEDEITGLADLYINDFTDKRLFQRFI